MKSAEIRKKFRNFFESRGHAVVQSSSLLPDDPSVLLTTAGMQQFKSYFIGKADPVKDFGSKTVFSIQKCFRTSDIEEVGDETHLTMFEMLGNFSFGDYFKERAIALSFEFITSEDGLGLDPNLLYVTAFRGDDEVPRDEEAIKFWQERFKSVGIDAKIGERIFLYGREKNWWEAGTGPAGPDAEMFFDRGLPHDLKFGPTCHPNCDCGRFVEIGNDVFMQYNKSLDGKYTPLPQGALDNGRGFERLVMVMQRKRNIFETDLFEPLISRINDARQGLEPRVLRVLADHLRSSIFLIADGVRPSNKEAGYILRRLLRRILVYGIKYDIHAELFALATGVIKDTFGEAYPEVTKSKEIFDVLMDEKTKFEKALALGVKEIEKYEVILAKDAFYIYESFGIPFELLQELVPAKVKDLKKDDLEAEMKKHQEISRAGSEKKFGGHGLILNTGELKAANQEELEKVTRLHTATHLVQAALRKVLGEDVHQMGSDITAERARFDFSFSRKLTDEEVRSVEDLVNGAIQRDLPVNIEELPIEEAKKTGALFFFKEKYPETVKVYSMGDFSKEFCGGPHVTNTLKVGKFKIAKQEAVGAGVRRIRISLD